jgi:hypothetical protein
VQNPRVVSYLASALPVGNHRNKLRLGERIFSLWHSQTFKRPYLESLSISQVEERNIMAEMTRLIGDGYRARVIKRIASLID